MVADRPGGVGTACCERGLISLALEGLGVGDLDGSRALGMTTGFRGDKGASTFTVGGDWCKEREIIESGRCREEEVLGCDNDFRSTGILTPACGSLLMARFL